MATPDPLLDLAAAHGLTLDPASISRNEIGLDFQVAYARTLDGTPWILRIPRRPDVAVGLPKEAAVLELAAERLSVAVPEWRVVSDELVAYPQLPGAPGLTLDGDQPVWHLDPASPRYAETLGRLLADLHATPVAEARARGIEVRQPDEVRRRWQQDVAVVADSFRIGDALRGRLDSWLADDDLWPDRTVFSHGELYPAHALIDDDGAITGVIDWTTARFDDPARDFMFQHAGAPTEAFDVTVAAYRAAGGTEWPRLADRCAALMAAGPIGYGLYALATGRAEHREAAQAQLDP
ncbi:macrolide 2'-phosphotransferase [Georgenia sunbinii]|uniref:macrolide 2'-phosphotransferase n=1 Tax=Georgenia sunbinii TaxID=3117728 RepID=UPI002F25FCB2